MQKIYKHVTTVCIYVMNIFEETAHEDTFVLLKLQLFHRRSIWIKPGGLMHLVTESSQVYASFIGDHLWVLCTVLCKIYISCCHFAACQDKGIWP